MNKRIKIFSFLLVLLGTFQLRAQQDPHYTQYMYNMNVINPAYAGSEGTLNLNLLARKQWVDIDGAPKTITFNANAPVGRKVGMGFAVTADEIGPAKEQNIYADFSYTIDVSEKGSLAFGLKGGLTLLDVNLVDLTLPQTSTSDDDLFSENIHDAFPNFGAGAFYYTEKFYIGFSVPNILKSEHLDKDNINTKAAEEMHFYLATGYVFDLSDNLKFKPHVMVKGVNGGRVSFDLNANFLYSERLELGVGYRYQDAVTGLINFGVTRSFRIGYAYDYTISDFSFGKTGSSHEIILLYDISFTKKDIKSPRFF